MINNCKECNSHPKKSDMISCENELCEEFGLEYFIYEWQKLSSDIETEPQEV